MHIAAVGDVAVSVSVCRRLNLVDIGLRDHEGPFSLLAVVMSDVTARTFLRLDSQSIVVNTMSVNGELAAQGWR
jgi:hypothetical protein